MDRLQCMTVFAAVAEEGSFAAGGRRLGMSPPAVTRAVAALEEYLGVKLLLRTTRHVRVSEPGQRFLDDARRILAALDEAENAAAGINAEPRGLLTVTAPALFGRLYVMPGIAEYLTRFPRVEMSALLLDRVVNLIEEGVDVAVRIGDLPDSSYKALRVGQVRRVVCAAPAYFARHGIPRTPEELVDHTTILASGIGSSTEWRFVRNGQPFGIRTRPRLTVTSNDGAIDAAVRGIGITRLVSYQVAPQLATGELEIALSEFETAAAPVHILHREGRNASAKIRTFVDLMADHLRRDLTLN